MRSIGFQVDYVICILPDLFDRYVKNIGQIKVPVNFTREFKYPIHRHKPIEEGSIKIKFTSPSSVLKGDKFHQWIGARYCISHNLDDFDRIYRQQVLLTEILKSGYNFNISGIKSN